MKCLPKPQGLFVTLSIHFPSSYSAFLAPPPSFFCPGHDFPSSLSSCPHAWHWAGRAPPHPGCALTGAPCPGSWIRVEEGLLGDSGKAADFQVGELRPREGTGLTQGHTAGTPMPLLPQVLPLCHQMDPRLSFNLRWNEG